MASIEIQAFGRRLILVSQLDKLEEEAEEIVEEIEGPAHYIPTPMEVHARPLGYHPTGYDEGFTREVST